MITVAHNLVAMNAQRQFNISYSKAAKSTEKLSSGYKVNRAADDAASLAISEKMRRQIRGLTQATFNVQEAVGYVQTADGALNEVHDMLQRMNELAVKSSNGTYTNTDRQYIDSEIQNLKGEIGRILGTTTFNEELIWDPETEEKKQIATEYDYTAISVGSSNYISITNENCGIFPNNRYITILADSTNGIAATWTGYDGITYTTNYKSVDWDKLPDTIYSFNLSDLFPEYDGSNPSAPGNKFYDSTGKPLLDNTLGFESQKYATADEIISNINGSSVTTSTSVYLSSNITPPGSMSYSQSLSYNAAYKSFSSNQTDKFSFDADISNSIVPNPNDGTSNVSVPSSDSETWSMKFSMVGVGDISAKMTSINYSSSDRTPEGENVWWHWGKDSHGKYQKYGQSRSTSNTSLGGLKDILTGSYSDSTPGILNETNGGSTKGAPGNISFSFDLSNPTLGKVGTISLSLTILPSDTVDSVLSKIRSTLNENTVYDLNPTSNATEKSGYISTLYPHSGQNEVPIYQSVNRLYVQSGSEKDHQIDVNYDSLSTYVLGIQKTNVLTIESSKKAISEIKNALEMVSSQRSTFGAYQNRFEHTINNLGNVVENTTAAESLIRDTDMAKEMVSLSLQNILAQAGQSMMAQANQSNQAVLSLLE